MKETLALVGCGDNKRDKPVEARLLYTSPYFAKKRQWAEGCDDWRILSAKHNLLNPSTELEPYDLSMDDLTESERQKWAREVMNDLFPLLSDFDVVVVLAGQDYSNPIRDYLEQSSVDDHWPFEGLDLFEQMIWLSDNPRPDQSTLSSFG